MGLPHFHLRSRNQRAEALYEAGRAENDISKLREAEKLAKQARALAEAIGPRERLLPHAIHKAEIAIKDAIITRDREKWMRRGYKVNFLSR